MSYEARVVFFHKGIERYCKVQEIHRDRNGIPWTCCSFPNKATTVEDCLANLADYA